MSIRLTYPKFLLKDWLTINTKLMSVSIQDLLYLRPVEIFPGVKQKLKCFCLKYMKIKSDEINVIASK